MKKILLVLVMLSLILLVGCDSKYNAQIPVGTYVTSNNEKYILGDNLIIDKITIILINIDEATFNASNNINVIEDMSTNNINQKYLSFEIRIKEEKSDEVVCETLYKPTVGGHGPDTYHMVLTYPKEEGIKIDIKLILSDEGKSEFYLSMTSYNNQIRALLMLE